ncbi:MAG: LysR family transcriptional regulator [Devosia sp.]|nr:LysR family transcriptional regulator [Devosia sp.]
MDIRRLDAFVKVVDLGSVTRAAGVLRLAQPALSQQIAGLEQDFGAKLLVRSPRGVTPTEAGLVLYRYASTIHRQLEEARRNIKNVSGELSGNVAVGLAPWSSASLLAPALLRRIRQTHPGLLIQVSDIFGVAYSELVLRGKIDLALLYGDTPPRGLHYKTLYREDFCLLGSTEIIGEDTGPVDALALSKTPLILPAKESFLRQMVDRHCRNAGLATTVVAEVQSRGLLAAALRDSLGAVILPTSLAASMQEGGYLVTRTLTPTMSMPVSICIPDSTGLTDAAFAVHEVLLGLVREAHPSLDAKA